MNCTLKLIWHPSSCWSAETISGLNNEDLHGLLDVVLKAGEIELEDRDKRIATGEFYCNTPYMSICRNLLLVMNAIADKFGGDVPGDAMLKFIHNKNRSHGA